MADLQQREFTFLLSEHSAIPGCAPFIKKRYLCCGQNNRQMDLCRELAVPLERMFHVKVMSLTPTFTGASSFWMSILMPFTLWTRSMPTYGCVRCLPASLWRQCRYTKVHSEHSFSGFSLEFPGTEDGYTLELPSGKLKLAPSVFVHKHNGIATMLPSARSRAP